MKNNNNKTLKDLFEVVDAIKVEFGGRFDAIDKRFDAVDRHFDSVDKRFTEVDEHFNGIDQRFVSLKVELIEKMDEGFRHQGVLLETMQDDINTLVDGQEVLHERIDRLQDTVSRVETKVEDIDARLTAVEVV